MFSFSETAPNVPMVSFDWAIKKTQLLIGFGSVPRLLGFTGQPPTPLNHPGKEHQKFEIFFKVLREF
jgi:hypothetical protein